MKPESKRDPKESLFATLPCQALPGLSSPGHATPGLSMPRLAVLGKDIIPQ